MPIIEWPADVPSSFSREGYTESPVDDVIRTNVSSGPEQRRPRSTGRRIIVQGNIRMTLEEKRRLENFYFSTIKNGTLFFDFPSPYHPEDIIVATFTSPFQVTNIGGLVFNVSISLETTGV